MSNGGSHTNFVPHAFCGGAAMAGLGIAGALMTGVANYRSACAERSQMQQLLHRADIAERSLQLSEMLRKRDFARANAAEKQAAALQLMLARRDSAARVATARAALRG